MHQPSWDAWSVSRLLQLRFCDLDGFLHNSMLKDCIAQLFEELGKQFILFRPHFWFSDEWFCPDGETGIAVPFYLGHSRLIQLERRQMFEVEGDSKKECMKILRHETGHAIENAFGLRRKAIRQKLFGLSTTPYPKQFVPNPKDNSFVTNIGSYYAQSHPDEDFAETFAVWLDPNSQWRKKYSSTPAIEKLKAVELLMQEIAGKKAKYRRCEKPDSVDKLTQTLGQHYRKKKDYYEIGHSRFYEKGLRRVFSSQVQSRNHMTASSFLSKIKKEATRKVVERTNEHKDVVDSLITDVINHCRSQKLYITQPTDKAEDEIVKLLAKSTRQFLRKGRYRVTL